jgi:hypothetical protein
LAVELTNYDLVTCNVGWDLFHLVVYVKFELNLVFNHSFVTGLITQYYKHKCNTSYQLQQYYVGQRPLHEAYELSAQIAANTAVHFCKKVAADILNSSLWSGARGSVVG